MSNAALSLVAAGAVPAMSERKNMSQSKKMKSKDASNVRDTGHVTATRGSKLTFHAIAVAFSVKDIRGSESNCEQDSRKM